MAAFGAWSKMHGFDADLDYFFVCLFPDRLLANGFPAAAVAVAFNGFMQLCRN